LSIIAICFEVDWNNGWSATIDKPAGQLAKLGFSFKIKARVKILPQPYN
jgi:hypothetical protein